MIESRVVVSKAMVEFTRSTGPCDYVRQAKLEIFNYSIRKSEYELSACKHFLSRGYIVSLPSIILILNEIYSDQLTYGNNFTISSPVWHNHTDPTDPWIPAVEHATGSLCLWQSFQPLITLNGVDYTLIVS